MIHDGWAPYDAFKKAIHQQCVEHLWRWAEELLEKASWWTGRYSRKVKEFLRDALALRDRRDAKEISAPGLAAVRGRLERHATEERAGRLDHLLAGNLSNEAHRRFQAHLARHRDEILTFLYHPDIEATNWPDCSSWTSISHC
jgi:transposase